jgi:diketogulonate reductase-like aldo/keto reductase
MIGISNADPDQIQIAVSVLGAGNLASVQNRLAASFRSSEAELALCTRLGVAFLAWGPLGGMAKATELRARFPTTASVADAHGVSVYQVTLAWLLAKSPCLIPVVGASASASIEDSAAAHAVRLSVEERAALDAQSAAPHTHQPARIER